ncbi:MAG TPA: T9SS type A sorting domain-containing protein, partial [Methylotenera sp.]|nr:T9SS type A sorting domain-containing protein [Methylotenera sp.]
GAVSYDVNYKAASSSTWISAATATTSTSVNISGLTATTLYDWQVRTNCSSSSSAYTAAQFTTTGTTPTCDAPAGLASSSITETGATVSWGAVSGAVSYDVSYKAASSSTWINAATATSSTSVNLSGLNAGTLYDWRVRSNCASSSSAYTQAQFTTTASSSPCPGTLDVSTNGTTAGAATIALNTDVKGLIDPKGDNDYYRFVIGTGGTITVSLTTLPADYQLALLNSSGTTLQSSLNAGTANETITRTVTAGTYFARIYPKNNGQFNASLCYTLNVSTGAARMSEAEPIVSNKKFDVSPNPVRSNVNLNFYAEEAGNATVSIVNQAGAVVQTQLFNVNAGDNNRKMSIGNVSTGMYYIKLQTGKTVQMKKIMISK